LKNSYLRELRIALGYRVFDFLAHVLPVGNCGCCLGLFLNLGVFLAPLDANLQALNVVLDRIGYSSREQLSLLALLLIAQLRYREIGKNGDDREDYHQHTRGHESRSRVQLERRQLE
jgi:hypothetical protein